MYSSQSFHIVNDGWFVEQSLNGGVGRSHSYFWSLPLNGIDQCGFFSTNVRTLGFDYLQVKVKVGSVNIFSDQSVLP
jgi:hypothetical protein